MWIRVVIFFAKQLKIIITELVIRLIHSLKDKNMSVKDIISCFGMNHRLMFMHDYLKPAMDGGFVEMIQPDLSKSPNPRFRLRRIGQMLFPLENGRTDDSLSKYCFKRLVNNE